MRQILHNERFRELEAAWRGLFFQVRRTETSADLKIFIYDIGKQELADELRSAANLTDTTIYRLIAGADENEPWAFVGGDMAFGASADDIAALARMAKICAAARSPFVSHMRPDIFGVHSLAEHSDPREWRMSADFDAGAVWAALRGIPEARSLVMTMPRMLARLAYGAATDPLETFSFDEFAGAPPHDLYVWSNGCFAVATMLAASFSENGWQMSGKALGDLEDLPLYIYKKDGETVYQSCAEVQLSQNGAEKLAEYGLTPLISFKNTDRIRLAAFQPIADPPAKLAARW